MPQSPPWLNLCQHLETQDINPQLSSPLYNGRIPNEIRTLIFEYALTESPSPTALTIDPSLQSDGHHSVLIPNPRTWQTDLSVSNIRRPQDGFDWLRPDNTEPKELAIPLLLTCRRAYLETHSLPVLQKEHVFYCNRGHPQSRTVEDYFENVLSKPAPTPGLQRKDLVRSVRLMTQQFWLEDKLWSLATSTDWFHAVEHFRITLRRCDWWNWEHNHFLRINPFRGNVWAPRCLQEMRADMQAEAGSIPFRPKAWGAIFQHMPHLKTLTIDFETSQDKKAELETIVDWAVTWRFPLSDGRHLTTEGEPVEKMSWRGLAYHWSSVVRACYKGLRNCDADCEDCLGRRGLEASGYGPMLYVWTVTWKPSCEES
ncbi:hypothetical protein F5X96DRAFT_508760 [Biscogniauxia mediterranea]|nr:hypothetical protein F5X96DRAFT_508760 [Biscogniauxia mediterranea]